MNRRSSRGRHLKCVWPIHALLALAWAAACLAHANPEPSFTIRFPSYVDPDYPHQLAQNYRQDVLKLAMEKSGESFKLVKINQDVITSNRNVRNLASGLYDVNWMHTNKERESLALPIRIPVHKGLIGWRLFFIRKSDQPKFGEVKALSELKALRLGQGSDWPDTPILHAHQFNIVESTSPVNLLNMLRGDRLDYFPRSVVEIWGEQHYLGSDDLTVDRHIVLVYPTAFYMFVDKKNRELARVLELGLERAIADGSFDALFNETFAETIARAQFGKRRVYRISNTFLPRETPLERKELWFDIN